MKTDGIYGNEALLATLSAKFESGTLAHAYMLVGPDGSGKKTIALRLAKAMCCQSDGEKPCGVCDGCKKVDMGYHPDVHFLGKKAEDNTIKVDYVRKFMAGIELLPNEADTRIYIIDDAQTMGTEGQNAILKTLEEPVGKTLFLLLASSEAAILPTIRSRCTVFYTERLPAELLEKIVKERSKADEQTVKTAVKIAQGSLGTALELLEKKGGLAARELALQVIGSIQSGDKSSVMSALGAKSVCNKEKLCDVYSYLQLALRDVAAKSYGRKNPEFFIDNAELDALARRLTQAKAMALYELLEKEKAALSRNFNPALSVLRVAEAV